MSVNSWKFVILLSLVIIAASSAIAFSSDRDDGGSDDPPSSDPSIQCWNQADNDSDGNTPAPTGDIGPYESGDSGYDPGCVNPYYNDSIEGLIWSSHMSVTFEGGPGISSPTPYFSGSFVEMGNDVNSKNTSDTVAGSGTSISYTANYIDEEGSESTDNWGFGKRISSTIGSFPDGAVVKGDRVVLPPNPDSDSSSSDDMIRCGDGRESSEHDSSNPLGDDETNSPPDTNTDGYTTECPEDWGQKWERYDVNSLGSEEPAEPSEQSGTFTTNNDIACRDDNMDSDGNELGLTCTDGTDASCTDGSSSCPCGYSSGSDGTDATCDSANDWSGDEGNAYWYEDSGDLVKETCQDDGAETYATGSSGADDSCKDYEPVRNVNGTCTSCTESSSSPTTYDGGASDSVSGTNRAWKEAQRQDCNTHNTVDGGTSSTGDYGNNDAATFTDFTSYFDSSWGSEGKVWCGYDYTTTVDVDGGYGYGDGFVVINNGDIIATENHQGKDEVGRHVWVDGSRDSSFNLLNMNLVNEQCPGSSNACIKYVNFYTDSGGWTASDNPSNADIKSATSVNTKTVTPDESYSVCKNINRINEQANRNSLDDNVIDCDYMENKGGAYKDISPLPEACGDENNEHLMVMEGPSVDSSATANWLGNEQACVSWGSGETDPNGRELDSNACVLNGKAYAEGSVMDVASPPDIPENYEQGDQQSPDRHVCLNIDDTTGDWPYNYRHDDTSNTYYGGQWYDLDDDSTEYDQTVNEYLRSMEPSGFTAGSIDSGTAGPSASGDESWIDYYYTENPNPEHKDYNPMGGDRGVALLADCGPKLNGCGDDSDNIRGEIAAPGYHDGSTGEGVYFAFSEHGANTFYEDSMDDDFNSLGESTASSYPKNIFNGKLNKIKSVSNQLYSSHPDYSYLGVSNSEWYYDTHIDEDSATQYAYTLNDTWVPDSTGVPYPAGGADNSIDYISSAGASTGVYPHINHQSSIRTSTLDLPSLKITRAHGNSIAVVSDRDMSRTITRGDGSSETIQIRDGEAYWVNPDDILVEWSNNNIDRGYWK